jgi:Na+/pantothenate symporter
MSGFRLKFSSWPKPRDYVLAVGTAASLWVLVMVFILVLPSIDSMTVHKSDKTVLAEVSQIAVGAAIASCISASVLTVCMHTILTRMREKRQRQGHHLAA